MTDQARGAGHTKGPWEVVFYGGGDSLVIHSDAENRVCFMATPGERGSLKTIMANARLIAAAPDLLAALETINAQLECPMRNTNRGRAYREGVVISQDVRDQVRAAIAKAKGEA
jgi:hypothetical protein